MKKKAFTLAEVLIVLVVLGVIAAVMLLTLKPNQLNYEAMKKGGKSMLYDISYATSRVLAKNSYGFSALRLKTTSGTEFSITSSNAAANLIAVYKTHLKPVRGKTLSSTYSSTALKNEAGTSIGLKPSDFSQGYFIKNGAYFAIKLNGNCTTTESKIYNPNMPGNSEAKNSCGLIFYDLNGDNAPNKLMIDQYIVSIGKMGIK